MTEYIVILAFIVGIAVFVIHNLSMKEAIQDKAGKIVEDLKK